MDRRPERTEHAIDDPLAGVDYDQQVKAARKRGPLPPPKVAVVRAPVDADDPIGRGEL
jgi:hypothetical protein